MIAGIRLFALGKDLANVPRQTAACTQPQTPFSSSASTPNLSAPDIAVKIYPRLGYKVEHSSSMPCQCCKFDRGFPALTYTQHRASKQSFANLTDCGSLLRSLMSRVQLCSSCYAAQPYIPHADRIQPIHRCSIPKLTSPQHQTPLRR